MKKLTGIILLMVISPVFSKSGNNYEKAMKDALDKMNHVTLVDDLSLVANQFERIAFAEKDNWLPVYYGAYARVMMAANLASNP